MSIFKIYHTTFFPLFVNFNGTGLLHNHNATKPTHPATVTAIPAIQGQAPVMAQLRGHSSCAKWRTVTVFFSSMLESKGRLWFTLKLKIPCWSGILNEVVQIVDVGVVEERVSGRRWKGDSMENSSWTLSPSAGWKGTHLSH